MKTILHPFIFLFHLLYQPILAQHIEPGSKSKYLDFRIGYKTTTLLDQNTSHLVYRSNLPFIAARMTGIRPEARLTGNIVVGRGSLFPRDFPNRTITFLEEDANDHLHSTEVPMRGNLSLLRCSVDYLRKIETFRDFSTYMGGRLVEEVNYSEGFVTPGLMNLVSLAPVLEAHYSGIQKSYFVVGISVPLLALTTRSAYHNSVSLPGTKRFSGFWKNGTDLQNIGVHKEIHIYASYFRSIGQHLSGGIEYNFSSLRNKLPRVLSKVDHELNLTLRITK